MSLRRAVLTSVAIGTWGLLASPVDSSDAPAKAPSSWVSPLAPQPMAVYRTTRPRIRPGVDLRETTIRSPAPRWIMEAALLALSATGRVSGTGRDTTADIGKPPLGVRTDPFAQELQSSSR